MKLKQVASMLIVGVGLGLLEAAWTTRAAPGATHAGLGSFAIGVVLLVVCWPQVWWVPGISMLEEATQVLVGSHWKWRPNSDWLFHHWSAGYFGVNLYPVISFTLITIIGEAIYLGVIYCRRKATPSSPAANAAQKRAR